MKFLPLILTCIFAASTFIAHAWGFFAHQLINEVAIYSLPRPMFGFYKQHADRLMELSVAADKRRYTDEDEAPRHYLDADRFEAVAPFDSIPMFYTEAVEKYSEDTLLKYGIVPWHVQTVLYRLTDAFKIRDTAQIIYLSADLCHYVSDACVPLHSTLNYDGQLTGQKGIHALWERRVPELFSSTYDLWTGKAEYFPNPTQTVWTAFEQSFRAKDSVLLAERELAEQFTDAIKTVEERGSRTVTEYTIPFSRAYEKKLNRMVEKRMRISIWLTAGLWTTAWMNAGQPELPFEIRKPRKRTLKNLVEKSRNDLRGEILGRKESH